MADRYWVGGSGTWDAATTTNWSETSGGAGGASAPTSADDVYFDGNSDVGANFTVTVGTGAVCRTFDANTELPLEFTMTFAGTAALGIYGSLDLPATRFTRTYTGTINFLSSTTGNTINTNGVSLSSINFDNDTGSWILTSNLTCAQFRMSGGTFDTGNNFSVNATGNLLSPSSSRFRQLNFNNSTLIFTGFGSNTLLGSNITLNAGQSKVVFGNTLVTEVNNWYDVELTPVHYGFDFNRSSTFNCNSLTFSTYNNTDSRSTIWDIRPPIICNNLILTNNFLNHRHIKFYNSITVNGLFSSTSVNGSQRWAIESDIPGTKRTITTNSVSLMDVDFRDITAAGSSIPWSGTRIGDAGGNSNIIFTTPKNVYWNRSSGGAWNSLAWALAPSGTPSLENVPLPQDTAIISDTGLDSGATISIYSWNLPNFDASSRTLPFNLSISSLAAYSAHRVNPFFCGDIKIPAVCTITDTGLLITNASNNQSIQCNTTIPNGIVVDKSDGTLTLQSDISTSGTFILTRGTLNLNALTLTSTLEFNTSSSQSRTINFNNGSINCGANWNATTSTNLLLTGPGSILMSSASAKSFIGGTKIYDGINLVQNGLGTLTITGTNTFGSISNNVLTSSGSTIIFPNVTTTLQNKPSLNGLTGSQLVLSRTGTSGTFTLSYSGSGLIQLDNVSVSNSVVQPASTWNAFRSTDGGGNTGWISFNSLNDGLDLYWVGGTGTWDGATNTNWALVSGGSGGVSAPTSANNVFFDGNSDAGSAFTVTIGTGAVCRTFDANTELPLEYTMTFAGSAELAIYGSIDLPALNFARTYTGLIRFRATTLGNIINTNGVNFNIQGFKNIFIFDGVGGEWNLGSSLAIVGVVVLINGKLDTQGYSITGYNGSIISSTLSTGTFELNLRNSNVTLTSIQLTAPGLTLDPGTSTITTSNDSSVREGLSLYNLTHNWGFTAPKMSIPSILNDFRIANHGGMAFTSNCTVGGNFIVGLPYDYRFPAVINGQGYTVSVGGSIDLYGATFYKFNLTGPNTPYTVDPAKRVGNMGENSGIIFPPYKTVYWNRPAGGNLDQVAYSSSLGGSVSASNFPVYGDTVVFSDAGLDSGATLTFSTRIYGVGVSIDASSRTLPLTISGSISDNTLKNVKLSSAVTVSGTIRMSAFIDDISISQNGATINGGIAINGISQFSQSSADYTSTIKAANIGTNVACQSLDFSYGTLNTNNNNLTCTSFSSSNSIQRTINLGTSKITLTGTGTVWNTATTTNLTLNAQNSTIALKSAGDQTFAGGGLTYGRLVVENP